VLEEITGFLLAGHTVKDARRGVVVHRSGEEERGKGGNNMA